MITEIPSKPDETYDTLNWMAQANLVMAALEAQAAEHLERISFLEKDNQECIQKNRELIQISDYLGKLVDEACDAGEKTVADLTAARNEIASLKLKLAPQEGKNDDNGE